MIDLSECTYWSESAKVSHLQRRVIVHSLLYYKLGDSVITDRQFDDMSYQLVDMQQAMSKKELHTETRYGYVMHDFDATTGFHIASRLKWKDYTHLMMIAEYVRYLYKKENGGQTT